MSRSGFVWRRLHKGLKQQVIAELTAAFQEVLHERRRKPSSSIYLRRLAVVYVRQSTLHQPLMNQESLKLQYALQDHARDAGWDPPQVRVIDTDLGCSRVCTSQGRPGFQELVTFVTLERVGIIFAYDVTRLARNCTDWYQLLDLCGYRYALVGDQDGIYDPATPTTPDPRPQGLDL